jgi:hypothetical protein
MKDEWDKEEKERTEENDRVASSSPTGRWPKVAAIVFFCAMVAGLFYAFSERARAGRLANDYAAMSADLKQTQAQVAALSSRLDVLSAPAPAEQLAAGGAVTPQGKAQKPQARAATGSKRRTEDPRWKKVEARLAEHQQMIDRTRQDVDQAKSDFESKLGSTRDELNGSIARNHEELVELQKRGERIFYEYSLTKTKRFERVGPLGISLRKANPKREYCDLVMLVDDRKISRKHVNLYEPVMFYPSGYAQPLEVIVYNIDRNEASGYVSVPKYAQQAVTASAGASATSRNTPLEGAPSPPQPASAQALHERPAPPVQ